MRLVVDAGAVEEDEDQRGLAHAVEHMVFRGTRRFPHGAIERWFDAIGMRRGADVNGSTTLDDTQYRMTVPSGRAGALDTALAMLAGMAREATFDRADAPREAGVLLEEWRLSRDADERTVDARRPFLYAGSAYAARPVLGDTAVLRRFDVGAMRRYYERWYRPELMAVIVVGDVDTAKVAATIRRYFAPLRASGPRSPRPVPPRIAPLPATRATVVGDAETPASWLALWLPARRQQYATRADYRAGLITSLWREVLRGRLEDAELTASSPLATIGVERRSLARDASADLVSAVAMRGRTLPALDAMVAEVNELARDGPTAAELDERGRALLRAARAQAQQGDDADDIAGELIDHFLTGNAVFTNQTAYELARDVLPTIGVEDVRDFARTRTPDSGAVVTVATTADDPVASAPPDTIVARVRSASARGAGRREDAIDVERALGVKPAPGRVTAERAIPEVHAYEWTLSNGMRLLLKPTAFSFDQVELRAVAPGGASLASDDAYPSAYLSDAIIGETGVGEIPAPRLERWLASTSISLSPTVSDDAVVLEGGAAPAELEPLFQLLHLYLTAPRADTVAFRRYRARMASLASDRGRDPATLFDDSVAAAFAGGSARAARTGTAFLLRARLDDALDFWRRRTANGAGFTVAIAGDFTLARIRPLVERYLASIPRGAAERPVDRRPPIPAGAHHEIVAGRVARARTVIGFSAPFVLANDSLNALYLVREIVARALSERLRDEMGGTYDVDVAIGWDVIEPSRYTMRIEFESAPERVDALAAAAEEELGRLRRAGPSAAQFAGAREARERDLDGRAEDNGYWVDELTSHARYAWPLAGIAAHPAEAAAVTLADARRACARYIAAGSYVRVTMRPRPAGR